VTLLACSASSALLLSYVMYDLVYFVVFFFFQAEDGIRDWSVTGVQTCALPISRLKVRIWIRSPMPSAYSAGAASSATAVPGPARSEERRVGKEWRSRWWRDH